jgi:hypothetical protein
MILNDYPRKPGKLICAHQLDLTSEIMPKGNKQKKEVREAFEKFLKTMEDIDFTKPPPALTRAHMVKPDKFYRKLRMDKLRAKRKPRAHRRVQESRSNAAKKRPRMKNGKFAPGSIPCTEDKTECATADILETSCHK